MTSPLPHRFRESEFRRYEAIIHDAVRNHPSPLRISCSLYNLSSVTMSCRLRDAMKSFYTYKWPVSWDAAVIEKFFKLYPAKELKVHEIQDAGNIVIGKDSTIKTSEPLKSPLMLNQTAAQANSNVLHLRSIHEKNLLCHLAANRLLVSSMRCHGFNAEEVTYYEQNYDVSFDLQPDGSYLVI